MQPRHSLKPRVRLAPFSITCSHNLRSARSMASFNACEVCRDVDPVLLPRVVVDPRAAVMI